MKRSVATVPFGCTRWRGVVAVIGLVGALCVAPSVGFGQTRSEAEVDDRSETEQWRDILRFGINSQIVELMPTVTSVRAEELLPEVLELVNGSNDSAVLSAGFDFLLAVESAGGTSRAIELTNDYLGRSSDLVVAAMRYLREVQAAIDQETRATLREIAERAPVPRAIGAIGLFARGGASIDELVELYRSGDLADDVRAQIILELGERGDPVAFDFVAELLDRGGVADTTEQRYAIDTLGKLGDERALAIILRQFDSGNALTRAYAAAALTRFDGDRADRALEAALRDEFWRVRVSALEAIGERRYVDALEAVVFKLRFDPEGQVRLAAVESLAAMGTRRAWDALTERLASNDTPTTERIAIIGRLVAENPAGAETTLRELVLAEWDDKESRILDAVGRAIADQERAPLAGPLAGILLDHPYFILQIYAVRAIGRHRIAALRAQVEARTGEGYHPALRSAARRALELR